MVRQVEEFRSGRQETRFDCIIFGGVYHGVLGIISENCAPESRTAPNANSIKSSEKETFIIGLNLEKI
jgi:hypothetical protein